MKEFDKIIIKFIDDSEQRYDTLGDYYFKKNRKDENVLHMRISKYSGKNRRKHELLILVHEMTEMILALDRNISFDEIDKFDVAHEDCNEPGRLKDAPYHKEHMFAEKIEKLIMKELNVKWKDYN